MYKVFITECATSGSVLTKFCSIRGSSEYVIGGVCVYNMILKNTILGIPLEYVKNDKIGIIKTSVYMVYGTWENIIKKTFDCDRNKVSKNNFIIYSTNGWADDSPLNPESEENKPSIFISIARLIIFNGEIFSIDARVIENTTKLSRNNFKEYIATLIHDDYCSFCNLSNKSGLLFMYKKPGIEVILEKTIVNRDKIIIPQITTEEMSKLYYEFIFRERFQLSETGAKPYSNDIKCTKYIKNDDDDEDDCEFLIKNTSYGILKKLLKSKI